MQLAATQGDFLSPIRAHFHNVPEIPTLLRSIKLGNNDLKYAQVQITNSKTDNKLWKLNIADISINFSAQI